MASILHLHDKTTGITWAVPYFEDLVADPSKPDHVGRLPADEAAHALFYYNALASANLEAAKQNLVYEGQRSKKFDVATARHLLESVARMYCKTPAEIVRYWDAVDAQRLALGFSSDADLPHVMRFRFT